MKKRFRTIGIWGVGICIFLRFFSMLLLSLFVSMHGNLNSTGRIGIIVFGIVINILLKLADIVTLCSLIMIILSYTAIVEDSIEDCAEIEHDDNEWDEFIKNKKS